LLPRFYYGFASRETKKSERFNGRRQTTRRSRDPCFQWFGICLKSAAADFNINGQGR
jgi:hypothetical protein